MACESVGKLPVLGGEAGPVRSVQLELSPHTQLTMCFLVCGQCLLSSQFLVTISKDSIQLFQQRAYPLCKEHLTGRGQHCSVSDKAATYNTGILFKHQ